MFDNSPKKSYHTFLKLFIVDVCLGTVTKRVNVIWLCRQNFVTTIEGIVNVFSLHVTQKQANDMLGSIQLNLHLENAPK